MAGSEFKELLQAIKNLEASVEAGFKNLEALVMDLAESVSAIGAKLTCSILKSTRRR